MRGGKAEKETKGGERVRERERGGGERLSLIQPCVSYRLVWRDGREGGIEGSRERERQGRKERKLKAVPLYWKVLDDSSDIKVFSLTEELLCVCEHVSERGWRGVYLVILFILGQSGGYVTT